MTESRRPIFQPLANQPLSHTLVTHYRAKPVVWRSAAESWGLGNLERISRHLTFSNRSFLALAGGRFFNCVYEQKTLTLTEFCPPKFHVCINRDAHLRNSCGCIEYARIGRCGLSVELDAIDSWRKKKSLRLSFLPVATIIHFRS